MSRWLIGMTLCAALAAHAQEKVFVALPPAFNFESDATAKLRKDCALADMLSKQIARSVKERVPTAQEIEDWRKAGDTPVVRIWITKLQQGVPYGPVPMDWLNKMTIRAELHRGPEKLTTVEWTASSPRMGDLDCPPFERITGSLGRSVSAWLPMALRANEIPTKPGE